MWADALAEQLNQDIARLYQEADDYNVKITVGEEPNVHTFLAHSVILRARSSFFRAALSKKWQNPQEDDKIIFKKPNIDPKVFRIILKYLYTGTITFYQRNDYISLLIAADELDLIALVDHIQDYVITSDNKWLLRRLVEVFQLCTQFQSFSKLREYCVQTISGNPQSFFKSPEFLSLDENSLVSLLQRSDLAMEEIDVWDEVIRWGKAQLPHLNTDPSQWSRPNFKALEKIVRQCIPHIRFLDISSTDYHKIIPFIEILPDELRKNLTGRHQESQTSAPVSPAASPGKLIPAQAASMSSILDSVIINRKHAALISHWINGKEGEPDSYRSCHYDFRLLFRGSRDGFDVREFHAKCDRHGATVVVIKINDTDEIIGGFNPVSWSSSGYYRNTTRSFIFSLGNGMNTRNAILSRVSKRQSSFAICDYGLGNLEDSVGFGAGDLPLFGFKAKRASYQRSVISPTAFNIAEFEVFQVTKRLDAKT
ncbi:hypothetical protein G9A89_002249 [Geosiphon pyriformis]|nr:hypothetical protein G9A89_002249 [Geosiphon pyriformis]